MTLLPVAEAQARLFALAPPLPAEDVPLARAAGRFAAAPVAARRTQPAADLSSMDGYAIRRAECPGPWRLAGESAAGGGLGRALLPGEATRIFTGAPLPDGADSVLVQEDAAAEGDTIRQTGDGPPLPAAHVRRRGSDFATGDRLIEAGAAITPARLALAAMGGHGSLMVRRCARIALVSTGNELVPAGRPTPGVMLPSSNAPMLAALAAGPGAEVTDLGIVGDDRDALAAAFAAAAAWADVIVTTGGASVGDHDLVRPALIDAGAEIDFWRVAMRPGKPLMAGRLGEAVVLGLPGNPVSAFVTAFLFLKPLIAHRGGSGAPLPATLHAPLLSPLPPAGTRADFLRGRRREGGVEALGRQDSGDLRTLAAADCLIVRQPGAAPAEAGELAAFLPIA